VSPTTDPSYRADLLALPLTAVLATMDEHGSPHAVPVWFLYDGEVFEVITDRGSAKHRNALRTGQAAICVEEGTGRLRYASATCSVQVHGQVTLEERRALHVHYRGPQQGSALAERGGHERMVKLVLRPEHWY
jgi:PPOX class probable F420-dependent enzyme